MKKVEAQEIALKVSHVVMEYIDQILTDSIRVNGKIDFVLERVDGYKEPMCVFVISVPQREFNRRINSKIPNVHSDVFYMQLLNDLADSFLNSETIKIGTFYNINGIMGPTFHGIDVKSLSGNSIKINFRNIGTEIRPYIEEYNNRIWEYEEGLLINRKK